MQETTPQTTEQNANTSHKLKINDYFGIAFELTPGGNLVVDSLKFDSTHQDSNDELIDKNKTYIVLLSGEVIECSIDSYNQFKTPLIRYEDKNQGTLEQELQPEQHLVTYTDGSITLGCLHNHKYIPGRHRITSKGYAVSKNPDVSNVYTITYPNGDQCEYRSSEQTKEIYPICKKTKNPAGDQAGDQFTYLVQLPLSISKGQYDKSKGQYVASIKIEGDALSISTGQSDNMKEVARFIPTTRDAPSELKVLVEDKGGCLSRGQGDTWYTVRQGELYKGDDERCLSSIHNNTLKVVQQKISHAISALQSTGFGNQSIIHNTFLKVFVPEEERTTYTPQAAQPATYNPEYSVCNHQESFNKIMEMRASLERAKTIKLPKASWRKRATYTAGKFCDRGVT